MASESTCPLCFSPSTRTPVGLEGVTGADLLTCRRCGTYGITAGGQAALNDHPEARARLQLTASQARTKEPFVIESLTVAWAAAFVVERRPTARR